MTARVSPGASMLKPVERPGLFVNPLKGNSNSIPKPEVEFVLCTAEDKELHQGLHFERKVCTLFLMWDGCYLLLKPNRGCAPQSSVQAIAPW